MLSQKMHEVWRAWLWIWHPGAPFCIMLFLFFSENLCETASSARFEAHGFGELPGIGAARMHLTGRPSS